MSLQQDIEPSLQCPICCDFYRNPVLLVGCHHSFCSECLHRNFKSVAKAKTTIKTKLQCPVCRYSVSQPVDKYLVPNRTLEEIVQQYCQVIKPKLERVPVNVQGQGQGQGQPPCQNNYKTSTTTNSNTKSKSKNKMTTSSPQPSSPLSPPPSSSVGSRRSPPTKVAATPPVPSSMEQQHVHKIHNAPTDPQDSPPPPPLPQRRPKKRTTYYNKLKFQDLKKLCIAEQLPTHGSEAVLRTRHEEWVLCYNAECDSSHPKSIQVLRHEFLAREQAKVREQFSSTKGTSDTELVSLLFRNRNSGKKAISGNVEFDTQFQMNFRNLIQQVRQRQQRQPPSQKGKMIPPLRQSKATSTTTTTLSTNHNHHNHNNSSTSLPTIAATIPISSRSPLPGNIIPPPTLPLSNTNVVVSSSLSSPSAVTSSTTTTTATTTRGATTTATAKVTPKAKTSPHSACQNNQNTVNRSSFSTTITKKRSSNNTTTSSAASNKKLKWTCPMCTYSNTSIAGSRTRARCLMCQTARPISSPTNNSSTNTASVPSTTIHNSTNNQVVVNMEI